MSGHGLRPIRTISETPYMPTSTVCMGRMHPYADINPLIKEEHTAVNYQPNTDAVGIAGFIRKMRASDVSGAVALVAPRLFFSN